MNDSCLIQNIVMEIGFTVTFNPPCTFCSACEKLLFFAMHFLPLAYPHPPFSTLAKGIMDQYGEIIKCVLHITRRVHSESQNINASV